MELRLSLVAGRGAVTYVSPLVTNSFGDRLLIEGLRCSSIERRIGMDYFRHPLLLQAGARFFASCRERSNA